MTGGRKDRSGPATPGDYETARAIAAGSDVRARATLATDPGSPREILFYMADDADASVRRAVAGNPSTPVQASPKLAQDIDVDVRRVLAKRLCQMLPGLDEEAQASLYAIALSSIEQLARDQVVAVRQAVATSLADIARAPPKVVRALAADAERAVAEPVIRSCTGLGDEDLLALIASHPESWRLQAIASRPGIGEAVCDSLQAAGDEAATLAMVQNPESHISAACLGRIIDGAKGHPALTRALNGRPGIPAGVQAQIDALLEGQVADIVDSDHAIDAETRADVKRAIRSRMRARADRRPASERVADLALQKRLDEDAIADALGMDDLEFVRHALARLANIPEAVVAKILASASPRPVVALAWISGLSMRFAMTLQARGAGVPAAKILNARAGVNYPLTPDDMAWQLEFFGVTVSPAKLPG